MRVDEYYLMEFTTIIALACAVLAAAFLLLAIATFRRRQTLGTLASTLVGLLLLTLGALMATITVATKGYRAITREEVVATAEIEPTGPQRFTATFIFAEGGRQEFELTGDQLYVDAHILKWKPLANLLGLHTTYELDRIGGRYIDIGHERDRSRTLFSLKKEKAMDMFTLRRRYGWLGPLLDAEYGSATFITVDRPTAFEVRVSTSGLLIRQTVSEKAS